VVMARWLLRLVKVSETRNIHVAHYNGPADNAQHIRCGLEQRQLRGRSVANARTGAPQ
jgi:hypothetical protein